MSAEILRQAADRLDDLADRADLSVWDAGDDENSAIRKGEVLGKALAAWLRTEAKYNGSVLREPYLSDPTSAVAQMVAVARAILGGEA